MAAGVSSGLWEVADIEKLVEDAEIATTPKWCGPTRSACFRSQTDPPPERPRPGATHLSVRGLVTGRTVAQLPLVMAQRESWTLRPI